MEDVKQRIKSVVEEKDWLIKVIIGGLLLYVPILNAISAGYLVDLIEDVKEDRPIELLPWKDFQVLFMKGLPIALLMIAFSLANVFVNSILGFIPCIGPILSIILSLLVVLFMPIISVLFAYQILEKADWAKALEVEPYIESFKRNLNAYVRLGFLFLGALIVSPIIGLCIFSCIPYFFFMVVLFPLVAKVHKESLVSDGAAEEQEVSQSENSSIEEEPLKAEKEEEKKPEEDSSDEPSSEEKEPNS